MVATTLQNLGNANGQRTTVLLGETAEGLRASIVATNTAIAASGKPAVRLVYYSGHADTGGLRMGDTVFPWKELKDVVTRTGATARLLVVDGCRSGAMTRVKGIRRGKKRFTIGKTGDEGVRGMAVATSSTAGEDSHESDRLGGSFFTHHLAVGLRSAADRDREVTLDEAYAYPYDQTLRSRSGTDRLQHHTYDYLSGRGVADSRSESRRARGRRSSRWSRRPTARRRGHTFQPQ